MSRHLHALTIAGLWVVWCSVSASAETLRCQSVNGNLNCAGSHGVSCQTVNGRTTCISGHGDAVQSFGKAALPEASDDDAAKGPVETERLEQHGPGGHSMLLDRNAEELHLRTDWLSIDRE
jgi:hypothetical protein